MEPHSDADLSFIWQLLDLKMRERYTSTEQSYELWFGRMQLSSLDADRAVLVCENENKRGIIARIHTEFIRNCLTEVIGYTPEVVIGVDESLAPTLPEGDPDSPWTILKQRQEERERREKEAADAARTAENDDPAADSDRYPFLLHDSGSSRPEPAAANAAVENAHPAALSDDAGFPGLWDDEDDEDDAGTAQNGNPLSATDADADGDGFSEGVSTERKLTYNAEYTFENFIVGASNRFAHAAAYNVAEHIGADINPLFIWGPSGLGKTHLMYAIANRALQRNPDMKVIYIKGEDFTNQLVAAIRHDRNLQFRAKFRSADMLLIDDIQFIAGKDATQTEFFHTFDALYEDKKQIILTSDRPPKDLTGLEERIKSRFEAGLLADIQPPDYELRMAILQKKLSQNHMTVPMDVVDFLAVSLQENIRQLEGVVKKLAMANLLSGQPVNMEMVLQTVPEYLRDSEPVTDTITRIIATVSRHFNVDMNEIIGVSRKKEIKNARNVSMYVIRSVTGISLPQIGRVFNRDHSTVHSNINAVETELLTNRVLEATINEIVKEIKR